MNRTENKSCVNYHSNDGIKIGELVGIIYSNKAENLEVSYVDINDETSSDANSCFVRDNNVYIYNEDVKETYVGKDFINNKMLDEIKNLKMMIRNESINRIFDDFRIVTDVTIFKNKKTGKFTSIVLSNND